MIKHILVIDDDPGIIHFVESRLKPRGFEVSTARNGKLALEVIAQKRPDLVISDALMPEMDGLDFYKEFKKDEENANVPIIIITAHKELEDKFRAMGVEAFINKPFMMDQLLITMEKLLGEKTKRCILIAGNFNAFNILGRHFKNFHYEVVSVVKSSDLIQKVKKLIPRIILVEIFLDDNKTSEVIRTLRQMPTLRDTVILLASNSSPDNSKEGNLFSKNIVFFESAKLACIKAGAIEYIGQPGDKDFWSKLKKYEF